jgi:hypothetical protein
MLLRRAIAIGLASFLAFAGGWHGHARVGEQAECSACVLHAASSTAPAPSLTPLLLEVDALAPHLLVAPLASRTVESAVLETGPPVV